MSDDDYLRVKTCVLKVSIHCDGCKKEVKRILRKVEGVYNINIDVDTGKVTVIGNLEPETLIKKLRKKWKYADLWDAPKINDNKTLNNQFKSLQINNGIGGSNITCNNPSKNQAQGCSGHGQSSQVQQVRQFKATQEEKLPFNKDRLNKKHFTFPIPCDDLTDDDEFEEDDDDFDEDDDDQDEENDDMPLNKMKSIIGTGNVSGGPMMPNASENINKKARNAHILMKSCALGESLSGSVKVGTSNVKSATQTNNKGGSASGMNNNNGGYQTQGGVKGNYNNGNTQGDMSKNVNYNNYGGIVDASNKNQKKGNGSKKGHGLNNEPQRNHSMTSNNCASEDQMKITSMGQMGHMNNPLMSQTSNIASLLGLQGPCTDQTLGSYHKLMMTIGNGLDQRPMNVPPPPSANHIPPMPYPTHDTHAPPETRRADEYTIFSEEDKESCIVM